MARRKAEWRKVQPRLVAAAGFVPKRGHKSLKDYFFRGADPGGATHQISVEVLRWWLHPSSEALSVFHAGSDIPSTRNRFWSFCSALGGAVRGVGDADYGLMGGREQLIVRTMNPGLDYRALVPFASRAWPHVKEVPACDRPWNISNYCLNSTAKELTLDRGAGYMAYEPGLVLWDHLSYALDRYPGRIYGIGKDELVREDVSETTWKSEERAFENTLGALCRFFDLPVTADPRQRPSTVAFAEHLIARFEAGEFCDALQERWEAVVRDPPPLDSTH